MMQAAAGGMLMVVGPLSTAGACRPTPKPVDLPPVEELNSVGPGDTFTLEIIGEDNLPTEYDVAPDGTVALPFVNRVEVAGLEPQEISEKVRLALVAGAFFTDPVVVVRITAFKSKQITVAGQVKKPNSFPYRPGLTLSAAIAQAGGMTTLARSWQVVLVRNTREGAKKVIVDYDAINNNEIEDVPLQAGDKITVPERAF
ncbi:MAG: polysaccharide biosynthesis/export family protein [Myxococcota bacterium]